MDQGAGESVQFVIDTRASQFTVQAFAEGLLSGVAHSPKIAIREWSGEVRFTPQSLRDASLTVRIKLGSLRVLDEMRDSDRREIHRVMFREVLNIDTYPDVAFDSYEITSEKQNDTLFRVKVNGKLSLHGVSADHSFNALVAFGVDSFRAYGEFLLMQPAYEIPVANIASGTLRLRDELKLSFYVVAKKRE
jgi:polyisoprenoid-binding protein YceI